jgi:hypothetical protein
VPSSRSCARRARASWPKSERANANPVRRGARLPSPRPTHRAGATSCRSAVGCGRTQAAACRRSGLHCRPCSSPSLRSHPADALAQPGDPDATAEEARRLESYLVAPCCWTEPLDVHDSPLAHDLRDEISARLGRGEPALAIERDPRRPVRGTDPRRTLRHRDRGRLGQRVARPRRPRARRASLSRSIGAAAARDDALVVRRRAGRPSRERAGGPRRCRRRLTTLRSTDRSSRRTRRGCRGRGPRCHSARAS